MIDFIKNFEFTPLNILKLVGGIFAVLIIGSFVQALLSSSFGVPSNKTVSFFNIGRGGSSVSSVAPVAYYEGSARDAYSVQGQDSSYAYGKGDLQLSISNVKSSIGVPPVMPQPSTVEGNDAENYEVTDYSVSIETRNKEQDCGQIKGLKKLSYVIFENANDYQDGCTYTFKVEHEKVDEVLAIIQALDPKSLSQNVYTIKSQITDYTSEADILQKKLDSIDETLKSALKAYEDISIVATRNQNSDALAKIIDSKINIIERLTQERISVSSQLERLERSKGEQLDRLKYTYFNVSVYKNVYFDIQTIHDSWKSAVKKFISDTNAILQGLTVNLIAFLLLVLQYILYFFIVLFIAKFVWKLAKDLWMK